MGGANAFSPDQVAAARERAATLPSIAGAPAWARNGVRVESLFDDRMGTLARDGHAWSVTAPDGHLCWMGRADGIGEYWRPSSQDVAQPLGGVAGAEPARSLVEVMGAVLHELRTSGPLGLHVDELEERIGARGLVDAALSVLANEGRVSVRGERATISAAQTELDEALSEAASETSRAACLASALDATRSREINLQRQRDTWLGSLARDEALATAFQDSEAWRSLAIAALDRLLHAPESRQDHARPASNEGALGREALGRVVQEALRVSRGDTVGDVGEAVLVHARHRLGAWIHELSIEARKASVSDTPVAREAYARGLFDASWIVSYGGPLRPRRLTARVILGDGTAFMCSVLGRTPADPRRPYVLSAPGVIALIDGDGAGLDGAPYRLHPDDLAALRGESLAAVAGTKAEG